MSDVWPENRGEAERMEIYRVKIVADVAVTMGTDSIKQTIADMFDSNTSPDNWDVFEVTVVRRDEVEFDCVEGATS